MPANLGKYFKVFILFSSIIFGSKAKSQSCSQSLDFVFKPSLAGQGINWAQFPEFSLPFKIIYGGVSRFANVEFMLKRGYTHFASPNDLTKLASRNRAYVYYNVASAVPNQPWQLVKSPWLNDMKVYENYWNEQVKAMISRTNGANQVDADMFFFDIERQIKSDDSILILKNSVFTPAEYKSLTDAAFVERYKRDLQSLYFKSVDYVLKNGKPTSQYISSYADAPILNTFISLQGRTWEAWKTDKTALNYLNYDFDKKEMGGNLYNSQSAFTPSAYFYYDYPHPFAGEYLSYMLFQLEANRAWTSKDLILFVWQKYSYNQDYIGKIIKPWMAEAMAIFPLMGGAKGIFFWEDTSVLKDSEDLSNYEYFTKGLYRLSKYKDMFEGSYKLIETVSARDYNESKKPIWRGVLKDNYLLVAAHNPFAKSETEVAKVQIAYGNWNKEITLTGYENFLCKYDLSLPTSLEPNIEVVDLICYPNPSLGQLNIKVKLKEHTSYTMKIYSIDGKLLFEEIIDQNTLEFTKTIANHQFNETEVIVKLENENFNVSQKVILNKN